MVNAQVQASTVFWKIKQWTTFCHKLHQDTCPPSDFAGKVYPDQCALISRHCSPTSRLFVNCGALAMFACTCCNNINKMKPSAAHASFHIQSARGAAGISNLSGMDLNGSKDPLGRSTGGLAMFDPKGAMRKCWGKHQILKEGTLPGDVVCNPLLTPTRTYYLVYIWWPTASVIMEQLNGRNTGYLKRLWKHRKNYVAADSTH